MKVLGIDPGFGRCGYGIITIEGSVITPITYGCIDTPKTEAYEQRLSQIFDELQGIIKEHAPERATIEKLFFSRNVTTAFQVGQARGVIILALAQHNIPIFELTPNQVKMAVTGYGNAKKDQVSMMVQRILKLKEIPKPDDAADALACAIAAPQR